ncbi:MAG TPA: hypothetical protein VK537_09515 [Galbitalea sp.]|nr:hypothetical protein [Galbitalea sp.]
MSTVAQKLGIKPDTRIAVDGLSVDATATLLGERPDGVVIGARDGSPVDQLILVAEGLSELASQLPGVWDEIANSGRLWVWYRKGASRSRTRGSEVPLHRDTLQAVLAEHGMDGVTLISIDDTWSSMRVREL